MGETRALIDALRHAHDSATRIVPPSGRLTRRECLTVQSAVMDHLGPVAGFKIGAGPGPLPIVAPIPQRYVVANGGRRPVRDRLGIELEIGFELLAPLPGPALTADPARLFRPLAALELVETRLDGPGASDPMLKFADFQINAGLVAGDRLNGWTGSDFGTVRAELRANGRAVFQGNAPVPGGSALSSLERLAATLGDHCGGVQPGQIILTGSLCGLPYFGPGTEIEGEIAGLGSVAVTLC